MHRITAAEIATYQADRYLRRKEQIEKMINEPPQLGPRTKFIHYIYDEHLHMKDAIKKIVDEFPDFVGEEECIINWYNEEEKKRKERSNMDEER